MIVEINARNLEDINKANEAFDVIGKITPIYENGTWTFSETLFDESYMKKYENDEEDYTEYIGSPTKVVFFYYINNECIGQIRLRKNWNKYAFVEDLSISTLYRKHGIGSELIKKAIEWSKENKLIGLMLETQDNNLIACRFYNKCGFSIGAVDTMLYSGFDNSHEKAVFWYLRF